MTSMYSFQIDCPECGGELDHRDSQRVDQFTSRGEAWCGSCLRVYGLEVRLTVKQDNTAMFDGPSATARARAGDYITYDQMSVMS